MQRRKQKIDMLSGFPDEILFHILSFLPTKTSVSTSVLAKRWRFLWTLVPNLEFYGRNFKGSTEHPLDIVNRVIMLHKAKIINTFSLRLTNVKDRAYQLETMIIYPIQCSVRNLHLDFGFGYENNIVCNFPRLLLTSETLVDLKLVSCGVIPSSGELFLPSLKKLNLSCVGYEDDESFPHLLSGCPVLEEFIVHDLLRSRQENSGRVIVSSPTIKKLHVDFTDVDHDENPDGMLTMDVPALIYLKVICGELECMKSLRKTMTSLVEAELNLSGYWDTCEIDCNEHVRSIEFLSCLCHVKYLKITSNLDTLVHLAGTISMVKFVNLIKLELDVNANWYNLLKFLEVADNLEVLIINIRDMTSYKEPKGVPTCMLSCLRTVRLYNFSAGDDDAFDVVKYILRNAQVLERMEICPPSRSSDKKKFDALQRISLFKRVSKSCEVAFNTDEVVRDMINELNRTERESEEEKERESVDRIN